MRWNLVFFAISIFQVSPTLADEPAALKAGAATSNITPNLGANIVGGFKPAPSLHIHDELHARNTSSTGNKSAVKAGASLSK